MQADVRLILAPNPSPMTQNGTNTWLIAAQGQVAVIDPGPDLPAHQAAILAALMPGERIAMILVTHAHLDHSALAPGLSRATGAPVLAFGPAKAGQSALMARLEANGLTGGGEGLDMAFHPDRRLSDGEELALGGVRITALHTPGHSANHLCFACQGRLFSGDLAMGWASSLVSPPDGDMGAYMASLRRVMATGWHSLHPGHGPVVPDPTARLLELYQHRKLRESEVLAMLAKAPANAASLTRQIYTQTPTALLPAAERNVLAHLLDLTDRNLVATPHPLGRDAIFHLI